MSGAWSPAPPSAFLYGSGGGTTRLFPEPVYQVGIVPDALAKLNQTGTQRGRVVPDLSAITTASSTLCCSESALGPERSRM